MARRRAISRARAGARLVKRPATLAHATSNTASASGDSIASHGSPEHDGGVSSGYLILFGPEAASERRLDAHHGKEVAAGQHAHLQFRCARWIRSEAGREVRERDKSLEALAAVANVHVIAIRGDERAGAESLDRRRRADREDFARARDRKRPQQQRIGKAEDRAVGADADRQRKDRDRCETWTGGERAAPIPDVLPQPLQPDQSP